MILICYDGSDDARAAIEVAGQLVGGQRATVLTVWQPFAEVLASTPLGLGIAPGVLDIEEADNASRTAAERLAAEGAELARQAGFNAQPRAVHSARDHRARDPRRGGADRRKRDRDGLAWPHRIEIAAARQRLPRGLAARRQNRNCCPLSRRSKLA